MARRGEPRTFRPRLGLRIAIAVAGLLWVSVFGALVLLPGATGSAIFAAAVFVAWFAGCGVVYGRTAITVDDRGFVAAGAFRRRPYRFDEILGIVIRDGPGGRVYAVITRRGRIHFTSLLARHRELFELLRERAGLDLP
jgi:hypothetical protein